MKYYFNGNDENCYPKQYHLDYMKENEIKEMKVFVAKVERGIGVFFCTEFSEIGDANNGTCGKMCEHYKPRNGKKGICKNYGYVYENTEKSITLKLK